MSKRCTHVDNKAVTKSVRVHITRNKVKGKSRYTYHFTNGVVFHSYKSNYTYKDLRLILNGTKELYEPLRESYSASPKYIRELNAKIEEAKKTPRTLLSCPLCEYTTYFKRSLDQHIEDKHKVIYRLINLNEED